jgi:hypothetical protein
LTKRTSIRIEAKVDALATDLKALRKDLAASQRRAAAPALDAATLAKIDEVHKHTAHLAGFFAQLRP